MLDLCAHGQPQSLAQAHYQTRFSSIDSQPMKLVVVGVLVVGLVVGGVVVVVVI